MDDFLEPDLLQDPDLSLSPWTDVPEPFGDEGGQWSPMETQPFGGEQAISAASTAGSNTQQDAPRRAKMKRREHRKSRAGCFNCKSRKIKVHSPFGDSESKRKFIDAPLVSRNAARLRELQESEPRLRVSFR